MVLFGGISVRRVIMASGKFGVVFSIMPVSTIILVL